jgi:galactose-1-phosphate uridylyltransferase
VLDDPDYNAVIQSAPPGDESREYFVWHRRIVPRLAIPAGFELGSGMATNPTLPEQTADALRRAIQQIGESTVYLPGQKPPPGDRNLPRTRQLA